MPQVPTAWDDAQAEERSCSAHFGSAALNSASADCNPHEPLNPSATVEPKHCNLGNSVPAEILPLFLSLATRHGGVSMVPETAPGHPGSASANTD